VSAAREETQPFLLLAVLLVALLGIGMRTSNSYCKQPPVSPEVINSLRVKLDRE